MRSTVERLRPDLLELANEELGLDPFELVDEGTHMAQPAIYLASPFDLIPDFLPIVGYLDDVLVAAIVFDGILNYVDRGLILKYWPGNDATLERLARAAHLFAMWVPDRLKARIFSPRRA